MIVDEVARAFAGGRCEVSARVRPEGHDAARVWFTFPEELAARGAPDATPFLPSALHWAMRHDEEVVIDGPVSPRVLSRVDEITGVLESLFPGRLRAVPVRAQEAIPPEGADIVGCFFSRGVDSWHTALSLLEDQPNGQRPLTHLVFSPGFISADFTDAQVRQKVQAVRESAAALGVGFIEIDTNLKAVLKGPILVATALALGCRRMLIPSGVMQAVLRAKSTHPTLDYRFSTESTEIVHFGSAGRQQKMARIARSQIALERIDVCKDDFPQSERNCGKCEKCLRTMIGLHVLGALDDSPAFERPLDPALLLLMKRIGEPHSWMELLHSLGESEFDRRLAIGIRLALLRHEAGLLREQARDLDSDVKAVPAYRRASRAVARSMRAIDSAQRSVADLEEKLLVAHAEHR